MRLVIGQSKVKEKVHVLRLVTVSSTQLRRLE
jgi:hypothetical protein